MRELWRNDGVPVVDAHHHLWCYNAEEYGWIDDSSERLRRDFTANDLLAEMREAAVDQAIAVQARQTIEETRTLLAIADAVPEIAAVVGWLPLADAKLRDRALDDFGAARKLAGVRHVVQSEPDGFLEDDEFNDGIRALQETALVFEILIYGRQLPQAIDFVDRHPRQSFVLDHMAKPPIAAGEMEPWVSQIRELARRPNVACKLSGIVTEADWQAWSPSGLAPYLETAAEAFGADRLMAGSDWPVCLVACSYAQWWAVLREAFNGWSRSDREAIFGGNAQRIYGLGERCRQD